MRKCGYWLRLFWCYLVGHDYIIVHRTKNTLHLECRRCKKGWIGGPHGSVQRTDHNP
jgi:hypothetical protein